MIEGIVELITEALNESFPGVLIYTEHIPQGFGAPAFFVETASPKMHAELDNRYVMTLPVQVQYYCGEAEDDARRAEASRVAMGLYTALEYIGGAVRLRGSRMGHGLESGGALRFDVTYRVRFIRERGDKAMDDIDIGLGVRD